jgi:hypothetical protein
MRALAPSDRGRRAVAALVATLALLVAACGSDDGADDEAPPATVADRSEQVAVEEAEVSPFEVREAAAAGPGTPLGAGLEVPEGSVVLGASFPDLEGGGFRALLLVPGDPVDVFNDLRDQGATMGLEGGAGCLSAGDRLGCSARLVDPADGETLTLSLTRRVTDLGSMSGLGLRYRPPGTLEGVTPDPQASGPTTPVPPLDLPPPPLPEIDPADVGLLVRPPASTAVALEPGSELVGPAGACACDGDGWSFVVEVTGVIRDVVAAYGRQLSELGSVPDISDRRVGDATVLALRVGDGERRAEIIGVEPDQGEDVVIVTVAGG